MEPRRSPSSTFPAVVELDTGTYEVGDLVWLEFEVTDRAVKAGTLDQYLARVARDAIEKSRDDGREFEYLGKQTQQVDFMLEGCLVFGYPGDYQKTAEAGTVSELDECMTGGHAAGCRCHAGEPVRRYIGCTWETNGNPIELPKT